MKELLGFIAIWALILWMPVTWLTHVIVCFNDDRWGFLIAGALCFPVAMVHGTGVLLGVW